MGSEIGQIVEFNGIPTYEKYYSQESAWGAFLVSIDKEVPEAKLIFNTDFLTDKVESYWQINLAGKMQQLTIGMDYHFKAKLTKHKKWGWSYDPINISQDTPKSVDQQQKFLESIVTKNQAEVLLEAYPDVVDMVLRGEDIDVEKTKGIKDFTWKLIREKIIANYAIADILALLSPLGVSFNRIHKLMNYEPNAELLKQKLLEDPYVITEINGIGFKQADSIAIKLNPEIRNSPKRIIAFIKNYLYTLGNEIGHTYITIEELKLAIKENLIECEQLLDEVLENEKRFKTFLHIENNKVGLDYWYFVECEILRIIKEINNSDPLAISEDEIIDGIKKSEKDQGFPFTDEQKNLLDNMAKSNLVILTGKAGSGKTTLTRGLLNIYSNYSIACCALSAKAAKKITESTGFQASTIHRLLNARGPSEFGFNEFNKLSIDVLLVDEISMVGNTLFYQLIRALEPTTKLILCGDVAQLPPLMAGAVFSDLLLRNDISINRLTKILRQAEDSAIIVDANKIREGINPIKQPVRKEVHGINSDLCYMFRSEKEELNSIAIKTYLKTIKEVGIDNCYILTTRKDNALNSSRELSKTIQDLLIGDDVPFLMHGEKRKFKLGARVIHVINDYDTMTFNGDMGTINKIGKDDDGDYLEVEYPEKTTKYYKSDLNKLELAYSLSCHKFQGSEAKVIIGILDNSGYLLLDRTMLYTLLTRGKERVLLLAEPFAYKKAISEDKISERQTWMKYL